MIIKRDIDGSVNEYMSEEEMWGNHIFPPPQISQQYRFGVCIAVFGVLATLLSFGFRFYETDSLFGVLFGLAPHAFAYGGPFLYQHLNDTHHFTKCSNVPLFVAMGFWVFRGLRFVSLLIYLFFGLYIALEAVRDYKKYKIDMQKLRTQYKSAAIYRPLSTTYKLQSDEDPTEHRIVKAHRTISSSDVEKNAQAIYEDVEALKREFYGKPFSPQKAQPTQRKQAEQQKPIKPNHYEDWFSQEAEATTVDNSYDNVQPVNNEPTPVESYYSTPETYNQSDASVVEIPNADFNIPSTPIYEPSTYEIPQQEPIQENTFETQSVDDIMQQAFGEDPSKTVKNDDFSTMFSSSDFNIPAPDFSNLNSDFNYTFSSEDFFGKNN